MKYVNKILVGLLLIGGTTAFGQNNTSPYSIIGLGDLENSTFDRSTGMAGAGTSLSSGRFMYHSNPASYSRLDDKFFAVEMSGRFKGVTYRGNTLPSTTEGSADLQIGKLALAIKVKPWWGASIGFMPYSNSSYSFQTIESVEGEPQSKLASAYQGSGGLRKAYFANAFTLDKHKHLSVGLEASYLFGSLQQEETTLSSGLAGGNIVSTTDDYMHNGLFKAGFQYEGKLAKKWRFSVGAAGSAKTKLARETYLNVTLGSSQLVADKLIDDGSYELPVSYQFGGSVTYDNKFTIAADYQAQNWDDVGHKGLSYHLVNSDRYALGFEYSNKKQVYTDLLAEKLFVQGGFFYGNSYLQVYDQQLKNYGGTLGLGLNSRRSTMSYMLNVELGTFGTTQRNLIKQNYTQVTFTVAYRDFWFTKVKKYN